MKNAHEVLTPLPEAGEGTPDGLAIARSRAEPEQFALLFQRHAGGLGRYAARRLGPAAAEDIVAETFLAAFRHRDRYDVTRGDARSPKPSDWVYTKTLNATSSAGEGGMLFGPPDGKAVDQSWVRVDGRQQATLENYMGDRYAAHRAHTVPAAVNNGVASGPYTHIKAGQITGESAVLKSGIVARAGQLP
jgi:hypothetical protein